MEIDKLKSYAEEAGFEFCKSSDLSGESELDEAVCVGEYPCGESLNKFAELIIAAVKRGELGEGD